MRERIAEELRLTEASGTHRRLRVQEDAGPTRAVIDGREAVLFSGNDYLGLSRHPDVVRAASLALERHGASATASRLVSGNSALYGRLEKALARLKGTEAALVFPTGYMANLGVISTLCGPKDHVYVDKLDHASIYDGLALAGGRMRRYPHADTRRLEALVREDTCERQRMVVTDGVFSMDGDLAPLTELRRIADENDCVLVVDDAHGTGVVGRNGKGTTSHLGVMADVEVGTLSKALGSVGGFVACCAETAEYLVNKARPFIFTTGLPPASLAAAARSLDLLSEEPWRQERVLALAARVRASLAEAGFRVPEGFTPIVPVIVGDEKAAVRLSEVCLAEGVFVPAIRTPSVPKGSARLRMTLSAAHSDEEVEHAIAVLVRQAKEVGIVD